MNVNVILYDDFEAMDVFGPVQVLGKVPQEFHIRYLSVSGDVINSSQGAKIWTDFLVPDEIDGIVLIPGGKGARRLLWKDERTLKLIDRSVKNAAICLMTGNGSALLAQTGALYHRKIADIPQDANWNRMFTAGVERVKGAKVVLDGKFYSSSSTMGGVDMALWMIANQFDLEVAERIAEELGYGWNASMDEDVYC